MLKTSTAPQKSIRRANTGFLRPVAVSSDRVNFRPAQRVGRSQPRAEAEGRCPGKTRRLHRCGLKGRENPTRQEGSRGPSGRNELSSLHPGHRPSASALGSVLPARWAGRNPTPRGLCSGELVQLFCDEPLLAFGGGRDRVVDAEGAIEAAVGAAGPAGRARVGTGRGCWAGQPRAPGGSGMSRSCPCSRRWPTRTRSSIQRRRLAAV